MKEFIARSKIEAQHLATKISDHVAKRNESKLQIDQLTEENNSLKTDLERSRIANDEEVKVLQVQVTNERREKDRIDAESTGKSFP